MANNFCIVKKYVQQCIVREIYLSRFSESSFPDTPK